MSVCQHVDKLERINAIKEEINRLKFELLSLRQSLNIKDCIDTCYTHQCSNCFEVRFTHNYKINDREFYICTACYGE